MVRFREALVLDAAFNPLAVVPWQRAVTLFVGRKARVLEYMRTAFGTDGVKEGSIINHMQFQPIVDIDPDGLHAKQRMRAFVMRDLCLLSDCNSLAIQRSLPHVESYSPASHSHRLHSPRRESQGNFRLAGATESATPGP